MKLELPHYDIATQSPNKTRGVHWSKRARARKVAGEHLFVALCNLGPTSTPRQVMGMVAVVVTRWLGKWQRALDRDNAQAACKPLLDALVKAYVIEDDRPAILTSLRVEQQRAAGKRGTTVDIYAVPIPISLQREPVR